MERRSVLVTLGLGLLLVAALGWGAWEASARRQAETMLVNRYQQRFFDALGHVENVEVLLSKALVSSSPRESIRYLSELWQQAFSAQANLNALPLEQGTLMRTSRFLTQAGDFGFMLTQRLADHEPISGHDYATLQRLHSEVTTLGEELQRVVQQAAGGQMPWSELQRGTAARLNPFARRVSSNDEFVRIDRQLQEFPTLVYDGPFSDHIDERMPRGLGSERVDAAAAREIARQFVPLSAAERETFFTEQVSATDEGAPLSTWGVAVRQTGRTAPDFLLDVTQQGGHVVWMINPRPVGDRTLALDEAVEIAHAFLAERDFTSFELTYPVVEESRAIIPFAAADGDILLYPDQVKVTVALDNGDVVGFEALQFLMSHHERQLPEPAISADDAAGRLNGDLEVIDTRLAVIPRPDLSELLTWEVRARQGDNLYHVYFDAATGDEAQVLRIIEDPEAGRLAM